MRIYAQELYFKFGFRDGEAFTHHPERITEIKERLVPLILAVLPDVDVYDIGTSHNPLRIGSGYDEVPAELEDVFIDVEWSYSDEGLSALANIVRNDTRKRARSSALKLDGD